MKRQQRALSIILKDKNLSVFEKSVLKATAMIPRGETRSYEWVAARIGRPKAYRAVGNALNKNPYPELVPCHRVIRSDGSIGGYAWGAAAKRKKLGREGIDGI